MNRLAMLVAEDGMGAHEEAIGRLIAEARRARAPMVLIDIVADTRNPVVARQRALARVIGWIAHRPEVRMRTAS